MPASQSCFKAFLLSFHNAAKEPAARLRSLGAPFIAIFAMSGILTPHAQAAAPSPCRQATFEGELNAGQPYYQPLGNGLRLFFQPIHSGWITRVLPVAGPAPAHDYAELATPPYQSVTPLSLSTDFSFRAQDAVGWNPRRFHFATSPAAFQPLQSAYQAYLKSPSPQAQAALGAQIARSTEATLTILDARLTPGTADQWMVAAGVASHFLTTAHTLVAPPDGVSTPLGRLLWLRFRITFNVPAGFVPAPDLKLLPHICATS